MIRQIRKYATGVLAKLLLLVLAASFVLWGIADVFNAGVAQQSIAEVGDESISVQAFQQQMNRQLENYRQLLGAEYSPALISRLGVPQQVISQMINASLLRQEAASIGVSLSEQEVLRMIRNNASFQGNKGFDKDLFRNLLARAGMTEEAYIDSLKNETESAILLEMLDASALVSPVMLEALYRLRGEKRDAVAYRFNLKALPPQKTPDDAAIKTYYNQHADDFRTEEYRALEYVALDPNQLKSKIKISQKDLLELYESRKESYRTEERRKVMQLLYQDKEKALQAHALLQRGEEMQRVASQLPAENKEIVLGYVTLADIPQSSQEAVFAMEKGAFSNPLQSPFGWHIFQVTDIEESRIPDFDAVEPQLHQELLEGALEDALYKISTEIEDALASGSTLADAAKSSELEILKTPLFNRNGQNKKNTMVELPPVSGLLQKAFSGELENNPQFMNGSDGKHYFFAVGTLKESVLPKLEAIKPVVVESLLQDMAVQQLADKVQKMAEKLKKGNAAALLDLPYREVALKAIVKNPLQDDATDKEIALPAQMREELFALKAGEYTQAYQLPQGDWLIARLTAVHPLQQKKIDEADLASLRNELTEQYSNELNDYYMAALRQKYAVTVNEALLQSLLK